MPDRPWAGRPSLAVAVWKRPALTTRRIAHKIQPDDRFTTKAGKTW